MYHTTQSLKDFYAVGIFLHFFSKYVGCLRLFPTFRVSYNCCPVDGGAAKIVLFNFIMKTFITSSHAISLLAIA